VGQNWYASLWLGSNWENFQLHSLIMSENIANKFFVGYFLPTLLRSIHHADNWCGAGTVGHLAHCCPSVQSIIHNRIIQMSHSAAC